MNCDPTVVRVYYGGAEYSRAAHGFADQMEVDWVSSQFTFLAKMSETGVAYAPLAVSVVHSVTSNSIRIGALDNYVSG